MKGKKEGKKQWKFPFLKKLRRGTTVSEEGNEEKLNDYLTRLFTDSTTVVEEKVQFVCKWLMFGLLCIVEILILMQHMEAWLERRNLVQFSVMAVASVVLTVAEALKLFFVNREKYKHVFYVLEGIAATGFLMVTEGTYSLLLYLLMLTQVYCDMPNMRSAGIVYLGALPLYAVSYTVQLLLAHGQANGIEILRESFSALIALTLHFAAVQVVLIFYRQYVRLQRTLTELDESKRELEKAYAVVAEVTALEERQRIAKEIHDTAGHSLTTVIMQTEAAKRIIDNNPTEAKNKLVAANLQAKNTLDRLRECVHLLSGDAENTTLKLEIDNIIHETTDGTGIKIRTDVEEITVSPSKRRFICNTLKEGISNGLRHGGATAFWFELKVEDDKIRFLLSDNGTGLNTEGFKSGFGLTTMRDRARTFGGEVCIMSEPGEGLELTLTLPVDEKVSKGS